jgi:putative ABC transport system ATP-binding protein
VNDPVLLLADEPSANLDSTTGAEIVDFLLEFRDRAGTTTIVATHDAGVPDRYDRVIRLRDGSIPE